VAAFTNGADINGSVGGLNMMSAASVGSALTLDIPTARTWANAIGSRWGLISIHDYSLIEIFRQIETCSLNAQTSIGKGVSELSWTRRFGGKSSGANSINSNVALNGTGMGIGTNGQVSVGWRTLNDLWGNVWQFIDGLEAVDDAFRVIRRDGLGTFRNPMQTSDYESSIAAPVRDSANDGYGKNILYEDLTKLLRIVNQSGGSSSTYLCDYYYAHRSSQSNICLAGGAWYPGLRCGPAYLYLDYGAGVSDRALARAPFLFEG